MSTLHHESILEDCLVEAEENFRVHNKLTQKDLDELKIGYDVEDDDLPEEIEESSYVDELLTDGFHAVYDPLDALFGEPISGYSLY